MEFLLQFLLSLVILCLRAVSWLVTDWCEIRDNSGTGYIWRHPPATPIRQYYYSRSVTIWRGRESDETHASNKYVKTSPLNWHSKLPVIIVWISCQYDLKAMRLFAGAEHLLCARIKTSITITDWQPENSPGKYLKPRATKIFEDLFRWEAESCGQFSMKSNLRIIGLI